jgi:hypothetical protein
MAASSSSCSSSSARRREGVGAAASSPVLYRVGPLQYSPAVMCKCGKKAARWISWSDANPGRRYLKCSRARVRIIVVRLKKGGCSNVLRAVVLQDGGCDFFAFVDTEERTEFLRELLVDLRDTVWRLKKEKEERMHADSEASKRIEEQTREIEVLKRKLGYMSALASEIDGENLVVRGRISRLQMELVKERVMFGVACVVVLGLVAVYESFM